MKGEGSLKIVTSISGTREELATCCITEKIMIIGLNPKF